MDLSDVGVHQLYSYNTLSANDLDIPSSLMYTRLWAMFEKSKSHFWSSWFTETFYMSYLKQKTTF